MPILDMHATRRGRLNVFVRAQLPFTIATLLLVIAATIATPELIREPLIDAGVLLAVVATIGGALCPWERWGQNWMILVPIVDLLAVACLRTVLLPVIPTTGFLCVFPLLWLAYGYRTAGIILGAAGALLIAASPSIVSQTAPTSFLGWVNILALPTFAIVVAVIVNIAASFLRRANATVRKQRNDLQEALKISRNEQAVSRAILDTVNAGVAFYDAHGTLTLSNLRANAMVDIVGFRLDTPPYAGDNAREADRKTLIPLEQQIIPRALRGELINDHLEWLGPEGDQIAIMASCAQVTGQNTQRLGTVIVAHDVTDLANAVNVREEFLATVSHELRTPLSSILGYVELAHDDITDDPAAVPDYLNVIDRNARELLRRVSELLTLTNRELSITPAPTSISSIVRTSVERLSMAARPRHITITTDVPDTLDATVDAGRIEQVLDNLLQNAIKYSPDNTLIQVTAEHLPGLVKIRVSDQGVGMTPEEVRQATDKFYRAKTARDNAIQGVGIGLSIVQSIITAHHGTLHIDSTPRQGTTITLDLPQNP